MSARDRIKIGQIGVCHEHASAKMNTLRGLPDVFEIVGLVDDRNTKAARFAGDDMGAYEGLNRMTEDELLNHPGLQAVMIETPNGDLVPAALGCMHHGLPMHMDKPGGEDLGLFKKLLDGCREKNLPLQTGYMFRGNPAVRFTMKAIGNNWLGDIFEFQAGMSHDYGGEAYQRYLGNFRGGIFFNLGCHLIDLAIFMLGRPIGIKPFLKSAPGTPENIKNNCLVIMEYPHATASLRACSMEVDGLAHRRFKICGTGGSIEFSPLERFDGEPLRLRLTLREGNEEYAAGSHMVDCGVTRDRYENQLLEFAEIVRGKMTSPYSYEHDYLVQEALLAASGHIEYKTF